MSGKGSKPRPLSVEQEIFEQNWNRIFSRTKDDYQDILSTEDCVLAAFEKREEVDNENNIRERNL